MQPFQAQAVKEQLQDAYQVPQRQALVTHHPCATKPTMNGGRTSLEASLASCIVLAGHQELHWPMQDLLPTGTCLARAAHAVNSSLRRFSMSAAGGAHLQSGGTQLSVSCLLPHS